MSECPHDFEIFRWAGGFGCRGTCDTPEKYAFMAAWMARVGDNGGCSGG
jgi:hypothetical protein